MERGPSELQCGWGVSCCGALGSSQEGMGGNPCITSKCAVLAIYLVNPEVFWRISFTTILFRINASEKTVMNKLNIYLIGWFLEQKFARLLLSSSVHVSIFRISNFHRWIVHNCLKHVSTMTFWKEMSAFIHSGCNKCILQRYWTPRD